MLWVFLERYWKHFHIHLYHWIHLELEVKHMMGPRWCQVKLVVCKQEISPLAIYTHCYSHCLNLSIAASCQVQEVRNLISLINESYLFLSNSPKRQRLFELTVKEFLPHASASKLPGLCKTRWIERHTCFEVFLEMYEALAIMLPSEYPQLASSDGSWNPTLQFERL